MTSENRTLDQLLSNELNKAGYGHWPIDTEFIPSRGMNLEEARKVLKFLNAGCEQCNFKMEYKEKKKFMRPAEPAYAVQISEGDFTLSMSFDTALDSSLYENHEIYLSLRKRGDPHFKYRAQLIYFVKQDRNIYRRNNLRDSEMQQVTFIDRADLSEGEKEYFAILNITVLE